MRNDPFDTRPIPAPEFERKLAEARRYGQVARPGEDRPSAASFHTRSVYFDWWLINSNGAGFEVLREPCHTDKDIAAAVEHLRQDRDVVHLHVSTPSPHPSLP